jgi:antitoxin CptB
MSANQSQSKAIPKQHWLNRLRYRSNHRGCKETDVVLGQYCASYLETLSDEDLHLFEAFLEEDDSDIWAWLVEKTPCPHAQYAALLTCMRDHKLSF